MSKRINKNILIGLIFLSLAFGFEQQAAAEGRTPYKNSLQQQMELIQNDIKVDDLDIEPLNTKDLKNNVVPDAKQEGKKIFFLFLKTMIAVGISIVIIYTILSFIKKYRESAFIELEFDEYAALDLTTPTTKQEAFMSFLSRTNI